LQLPKVEVESIAQATYRHIKRAIIRQEFGEGPLTEASLSAQLGVSKTPVREALQRLALEGFVQIDPRRGAFVVLLTSSDVAELFGVREALEAYAVEQGFPMLRRERYSTLEALVAASGSALGDHQVFQQRDRDIHAVVIAAASNSRLTRIYATVSDHVEVIRMRAITIPGRAERSHREHVAFLESIRTGPKELARQRLIDHIRSVRDSLVAYLERDAERRHSGAGE
jgi:DNA-binding GntR family transcriptional regulator